MTELTEEPLGGNRREWLLPALFRLAVVAIVLLGAWAVYSQIGTDDRVKKRLAQRINIINQPPPPKKIEEKPPEQEIKEEINVEKVEVKEAQQANAPADNALGVDEEGGAGGDSFGLAAKKGGRDIIMLGEQKEERRPASRLDFTLYTGLLQRQIEAELNRQDSIRHGNYRVELKLWIASDGTIQRFQLLNSTGADAMDQAIQLAMADLGRLREPPPADMPQPVRIRLTSRELR